MGVLLLGSRPAGRHAGSQIPPKLKKGTDFRPIPFSYDNQIKLHRHDIFFLGFHQFIDADDISIC